MSKVKRAAELLRGHVGKDEAITAQCISNSLGIWEWNDTYPSTRRLIKQVIEEEKLPVASCSGGYFVIDRYDEFIECIKGLLSRQQGITDRLNLITEAFWERMETK